LAVLVSSAFTQCGMLT